jgi:hypothetical protein
LFVVNKRSTKFASAHQRIDWAKEHIDDLKKGSDLFFHEFFEANKSIRISEIDSDGLHTLDKIRLKQRLPDKFTRLTVQAIENLRAALDHAACAVVLRAANKKRNAFVFGDTKRDFIAALQSKSKDVPDEIKSLFATFKPYKRGNPPLWALNKICNSYKHRTIIEPGVTAKDVSFVDPPPDLSVSVFQPRWDRRKNEIIISKTLGKGTAHHDIDVLVGIVFGKVPFFGWKPVLAGLRYMTSIVESIVMAAEVEARRIGAIR